MKVSNRHFSPAEAARRLGVSSKALRLYEQRGLVTPLRTDAGWRVYGPEQMARAREIVALRALGFSLAQVARVLTGDATGLEPALAGHQQQLESRLHELASTLDTVRALRSDLAAGRAPSSADLSGLAPPAAEPIASLDLPWPWGGERFEVPPLKSITWLVGPLGSGKTRLAMALADSLPGARFLPLNRLPPATTSAGAQGILDWLTEDGAAFSDALVALAAALDAPAGPLVVDLVEHDLEQPAQMALAALLRAHPPSRPLILMTRSSAMLDLEAAAVSGEAVLFCPANHAPPVWVDPRPGAPGYEAVASCLGSPEARARTAGLTAVLA